MLDDSGGEFSPEDRDSPGGFAEQTDRALEAMWRGDDRELDGPFRRVTAPPGQVTRDWRLIFA